MSEKPINYASAAFQESLKRNKGRLILIGVIVFVVIVLLSQSLFVVGEAEQSVVSRFGVITRIILNKENDFHAKDPSGMIYETLGYLYIEAGETEKALKYNQEALEYDDEDPITLDNLGQTYYRLTGDKAKALEYFKKAHQLKPGQIDTLYFLAQYDIENGNPSAAKEKLETALEGRFSPLNYATRDKVNALLATLG